MLICLKLKHNIMWIRSFFGVFFRNIWYTYYTKYKGFSFRKEREGMLEFSYVIMDELGLHGKPAGVLAKKAEKFKSKITISKDGKEVNGKKMFGIIGLGIQKGHSVTVKVEGEDEEMAANTLELLFKEYL